MKKSILSFALIALTLIVSAGMATAGHTAGHKRGHFQDCLPAMELTAEQQTAVQKLRAEHHNATSELRRQLVLKEAELRAQFIGNKPEVGQVEKLSKDIGEIRGKLLGERVKFNERLTKAGITSGNLGYWGGRGLQERGCGGRGEGRR